MPMAGLGSRFAKIGITTPKPLIEVDGIPMFLKALSGLDKIDCEKKYTFVVRREHVDSHSIDKVMKEKVPGANVVVIEETTRGAVETCLKAGDFIDEKDAVVVLDSDLYFRSKRYGELVESVLQEEDIDKLPLDGVLLSFDSIDPRYSYAELGPDGFVKRTAEKVPISNNALVGVYCFASGKIFLEAAKELMRRNISEKMPEYYVSYLFNIVLEKGGKIALAKINEYHSFGTPEELKAYNKTVNEH
jgi:dTDP-glucose pyrophosphorylase